MLIRLSTAIAALALAATAGAAAISGNVFDDPRGYASRGEFSPLAGATVQLYRDNRLIASVSTSENGSYSFPSLENGLYSVAVDSRTLSKREGVWPEQTYGSAGAICDNGLGATTTLAIAGPCYAGRFASQSDDARQLATAKHVAAIIVAGADIHNVDFAFSDNVDIVD